MKSRGGVTLPHLSSDLMARPRPQSVKVEGEGASLECTLALQREVLF